MYINKSLGNIELKRKEIIESKQSAEGVTQILENHPPVVVQTLYLLMQKLISSCM